MKKSTKHMCLLLAFVLCMVFSLTAMANTSRVDAGVYGVLTATCESSKSSMTVVLKSTITYNPDGEFIILNLTEYDEGGKQLSTGPEMISSAGVTSFSHTYGYGITIEGTPVLAMGRHTIWGGLNGYLYYATTSETLHY